MVEIEEAVFLKGGDNMHHWLNALASQTEPAILITVAKTLGSAPRAAGAKMVVTATQIADTIGGGHLELRAIEMARAMLQMPANTLPARRCVERFSLGPSLGQCCGGAVQLVFERIDLSDQADYDCINQLVQRDKTHLASWRFVSLDGVLATGLCDAAGRLLTQSDLPAELMLKRDENPPCQIITDNAQRRWLMDACLPHHPHLMLFGAGHVGTAIVRALADLPCQITWVDEREEMIPTPIPANVTVEITDMPEALISAAPVGASFLVLTHSHTLDQRLAEHILRRDDFAWFGLIGSKTKRRQFEHRLQERGIRPAVLGKMVCPIGLPGIHGKEPAVIAASVVAQLLQVWEAVREVQAQSAVQSEEKQLIKCD